VLDLSALGPKYSHVSVSDEWSARKQRFKEVSSISRLRVKDDGANKHKNETGQT